MGLPAQYSSYINNHYDGMSPEQLILMLYKGALDRLKLVKEGIKENNIRKRGENLSKVIAIISELNSSVDSKMNDEGTQFLRGLYAAILAELPKVSLTNDVNIITTTEKYISGLKDIWETDVMGKGSKVSSKVKNNPAQKPLSESVPKPVQKPFRPVSGGIGYPPSGQRSSLGRISV